MKLLYISRLGKEFIGGADNLSEFLIKAFIEQFNLKDYEVEYSEPRNSFEELSDLDNYDLIFTESSALPYNSDLVKLDNKILKKLHVYMHSVFLAQENELSDGVIGPSAWDFKDAADVFDLIRRGMTPYFGSNNHKLVMDWLLGEYRAKFLDISKFMSRNMNRSYPEVDDSIRKSNAILFTTGYYHPGVGIHLLMKMIEADSNNEFEWYIVGRPFDTYYRISDGKLWSDVYKPLLEKPNVHLIEFTDDLSYYYRLCKFNLILSKGDSYSFKALEALSYKCINVTTPGNLLLPWSDYAIVTEEDRDLKLYAGILLDAIKFEELSIRNSFPNSLEEVLERYKDIDEYQIDSYIASLFRDVIINCTEFLRDTDIDKTFWKYNRLK